MNKGISKILMVCGVMLFAMGCAEKSTPKKDSKNNEVDLSYSDDLSQYRPVVKPTETTEEDANQEIVNNGPIKSKSDLTEKLDVVLSTVKMRNEQNAMTSGFTILVYSGNNERDAGRVRNRLYDAFPAVEAQIQYKLPTYFVKVGEFYQQIEAQSLYQKVKKYFPNATVVPEQFKLDK